MANLEHLKILESGVTAWNQWRHDNPTIIPDLREADLKHKDLSGINPEGANLSGADLLLAILEKANFKMLNSGFHIWASLLLITQISPDRAYGTRHSLNPI